MNNNEAIFDGLDEDILQRLKDRRGAMKKMGVLGAGLALGSIPATFALLSRSAFAQGGGPQQVLDTLNFALTLEYLEAEFYTRGVAASGLIPASVRAVFEQIRKHEAAHVTFLMNTINTLGGQPVAKPTFDFTAGATFPNPFLPQNYQVFLALAQAFEDTGVRAYKGQAANLMSNDTVLTAALQIHSVEARHAAMVRRVRGQEGWITGTQADAGIPTAAANLVYAGEGNTTQLTLTVSETAAFDEPLTKDQVLAIATLFIV